MGLSPGPFPIETTKDPKTCGVSSDGKRSHDRVGVLDLLSDRGR